MMSVQQFLRFLLLEKSFGKRIIGTLFDLHRLVVHMVTVLVTMLVVIKPFFCFVIRRVLQNMRQKRESPNEKPRFSRTELIMQQKNLPCLLCLATACPLPCLASYACPPNATCLFSCAFPPDAASCPYFSSLFRRTCGNHMIFFF